MKLSLKLGQSERKWLTCSSLFLQKRRSTFPISICKPEGTAVYSKVSHESFSAHGDDLEDPDNNQQWTRADRGKCSQDMFEPLVYLHGHCTNKTNHLPLFKDFSVHNCFPVLV